MSSLPQGWARRSVESICERVTSGGTPSRRNPAFYENGTINWFKTGELKNCSLYESEEKITAKALEGSSAKVFPIDTVLLAMYGDGDTITSLGLLRTPAATNQACCAMIVDGRVADARFLFYALKNTREELLRVVVGGAQRNLSGRLVREHQIPIPSLDEQKAIAAVLGSLDDKIEHNRRTGRALAALARARFKAWFVDFEPVKVKAAGATEFPGIPQEAFAALPDRFAESSLGPVPQGWAMRSIAAICDVIDCLHTKKPEQIGEGGRLLVQLNNIRDDGLVDLDNHYLISESDYARWSSKFETREGDCVITNVGRVGAVAQIPPGLVAALGRNMTGIRHRPEFPYPTFLIQSLLSSAMREEIARHTDTGTILNALNVKNIGKLRLLIPNTALLIAAETALRPIRALMEHGLAECRRLATVRDFLLPRLLRGQVRVRQPEVDAKP